MDMFPIERVWKRAVATVVETKGLICSLPFHVQDATTRVPIAGIAS